MDSKRKANGARLSSGAGDGDDRTAKRRKVSLVSALTCLPGVSRCALRLCRVWGREKKRVGLDLFAMGGALDARPRFAAAPTRQLAPRHSASAAGPFTIRLHRCRIPAALMI